MKNLSILACTFGMIMFGTTVRTEDKPKALEDLTTTFRQLDQDAEFKSKVKMGYLFSGSTRWVSFADRLLG
ncbi:hypothetical protein PX52LOC_02738 [Limnoglobus roseus]|uniref:Uncharacterized protein n=1 Tax=Limnoglobus roseus TaxID=2598579 RepID=A0A5C1ADF8_9BACT|nr:hypothetical protein PX52LOC_02738 [Limnoglobus roseus]